MTDLREQVARKMASALGDEFDYAFVNKTEWHRARGEKGGRYRDINEPMQDDYLAASDAIIALIQGGWEPVETAPRDGTLVDVWVSGNDAIPADACYRRLSARWGKPNLLHGADREETWLVGVGVIPESYTVTHWRPLPAPPMQTGGGETG